ncbi:D-alanyl-D-alanine carboxypeptidase DacF precursor [Pseudovibrio axinellae]|uniref:D-alanyl-D-alanine carboxypeptidase DacF n=1 Tax=Pseudovibrio axinellae TaxID=989403 RepID=A0A165TWR6_9HYPH|nr:D-alanyl-D-alanine carboxypeptidase [Pseudovibrio axinellae]KZL06733.1 D-alanyl-D-alanine carboxypeptidase DacF precursor [Pseudovibrio axinellae]SER62245.1 D-alanyl-D-alanine carboxypeptidase [Pseudovibrio axinellae]
MGLRNFGPFGRLKKALGQAVGILAVSLALATAPSVAQANAKYAGIVVDAKTGKVLYSNNATAKRYPASTTKIMTLYVLFEELEAGRISLNTKMKVSRYAARRPPTKLGLKVGGYLRVKDAIYALITKSANDASTVIAEHISGSETAFGRRMTQTARSIGMRNTIFRNPHGLPNSKQITTAADLALLGRAIQDRFPKYYKYFNTRSYTYAGRRMGNHNKLLGRVRGVDGIKTGYTNASGFNLVTSVKRDNRQIVAVVLGGRTGRSRDAQMEKLISQYLPKASRGRRTAPMLYAGTKRYQFPSVAPAVPVAKAGTPNVKQPTLLAYASPTGTTPSSKPTDPITKMLDQQANKPAPAVRKQLVANSLAAPAVVASAKLQQPAATTAPSSVSIERKIASLKPEDIDTSGWHIQISATDSQDKAIKILENARAAAGNALRNKRIYTEPVKSKTQTLYRARFIGFETKTAAWDACATLKKAKYSCYAVYQ